ncbi:MAG: NAD-dependent epimerase/dehydratase family protein [Cypionkella sp.]
MIVAITGGTGFIGAEIVGRHLAAGDEVRILSRSQGPYRADLTDPGAEFGAFVANADVLYHCAGEIRDPGRMHDLHVRGTQRLIAAAGGTVRHWIQMSSVGAYGPQRNGMITEASALAPLGPYETTKTQADEAVLAAAEAGAFACTILRPSNVIGRHMVNRSAFQMISAIAGGYFFFIGRPGAQTNYVAVANVAEAALCCAGRAPGKSEVFIISDACSFEDFAGVVAQCLGKPAPRLRLGQGLASVIAATAGRLPGFPLTQSRVQALTGRAQYSSEKLRTQLGYRPVIGIEAAIAELVAAWRSNVPS